MNHVAHLSLNSTHHVTAEVSSPCQQPFILTLVPDTALFPLKVQAMPALSSQVSPWQDSYMRVSNVGCRTGVVKFMQILWPRQILH